MNRTWKNVELDRADADRLGAFLYENDIEFESSECYDKIHFEVCTDDYETEAVNEFLEQIA